MQEASLLLKAESIDKSFPGVHAIDHVNLRLAYRPEISADVQPAGFPAEYPETVSSRVSRQSWARLIQKVYEIDLVCTKCGHAMKVISVVSDPGGCTPPLEVNKIMECLKRNNAPPFDKEVTKAS